MVTFDVPGGRWRVSQGITWRASRNRTYRNMGRFMIDVYKGSLHIGEDLDLILQLLAEVMGFP